MTSAVGAAPAIAVVPVPNELGSPAFFLARTPVTNAEYAPAVADGVVPAPPWWDHPDFRGARQPVVGVSWDDAAAYCAWLTRTLGGRWRLPTEAEWERAASGGLGRPRTSWGEAIPEGEIPDGPLVGDGPGKPESVRFLRHRHDRSRVVPRLAASRAPRESGRILAARGPLVLAVGVEQPSSDISILGLRVPAAPGNSRLTAGRVFWCSRTPS